MTCVSRTAAMMLARREALSRGRRNLARQSANAKRCTDGERAAPSGVPALSAHLQACAKTLETWLASHCAGDKIRPTRGTWIRAGDRR